MTPRELVERLRMRWRRLVGRDDTVELRMREVLAAVTDLSRRIDDVAARAASAHDAAQESVSRVALLTEAIRGELGPVQRALEERAAQLHAGQQDVSARIAEITPHLHALQLNQLELSRSGPVTFRAATSTQASLRLWRLTDGALRFVPDAGPRAYRVAVISLPKSGTYLMAEILHEIGYVNTHIQAWAHALHDYRSLSIQQMITDYLAHQVAIPIEVSAELVGPGQFWVGHFEVALCRDALAGFRKIFTVRDIRFALVSYMRWLSNPGRGGAAADAWRHLPDSEEKFLAFFETHGHIYLAWCRDIVGWLDADDVCVVQFEAITGMRGEAAQATVAAALSRWLGEPDQAIETAIRHSLGRETKTFSGRYSELAGIWSPRIDAVFAAAGGPELNRRLGYSDETADGD